MTSPYALPTPFRSVSGPEAGRRVPHAEPPLSAVLLDPLHLCEPTSLNTLRFSLHGLQPAPRWSVAPSAAGDEAACRQVLSPQLTSSGPASAIADTGCDQDPGHGRARVDTPLLNRIRAAQRRADDVSPADEAPPGVLLGAAAGLLPAAEKGCLTRSDVRQTPSWSVPGTAAPWCRGMRSGTTAVSSARTGAFTEVRRPVRACVRGLELLDEVGLDGHPAVARGAVQSARGILGEVYQDST